MKEQYIKQVKKEIGLYLSRKKRNEIVRDINEIFCSALEHGETEQQVIDRLGSPTDFVKNTIEQLGVTSITPQKRRLVASSVIAIIIAIVTFSCFAVTQLGNAPGNAIGSADAMTNIQVEGVLGINVAQIILAVGLIATLIAIIQIVRLMRNNRR